MNLSKFPFTFNDFFQKSNFLKNFIYNPQKFIYSIFFKQHAMQLHDTHIFSELKITSWLWNSYLLYKNPHDDHMSKQLRNKKRWQLRLLRKSYQNWHPLLSEQKSFTYFSCLCRNFKIQFCQKKFSMISSFLPLHQDFVMSKYSGDPNSM